MTNASGPDERTFDSHADRTVVGSEGIDSDEFVRAYDATPPWDIGRPQSEFRALVSAGAVKGSVLDVGCGTGENALFYAEQGHPVLGIDTAPKAIEAAREKALARESQAVFELGDALQLDRFGRVFDTVTDCGLFHILSDANRPRYVSSLRSVLPKGGRLFLMTFSEKTPGGRGPRRVTQEEIRVAFAEGWVVREIVEARFENTVPNWEVFAWRSWIDRV